jgi:DNA-binding NarL/FixJ family response regulator
MSQKSARFAEHQKMRSNRDNISNRIRKIRVEGDERFLHMNMSAALISNDSCSILIVEDHEKLRVSLVEWLKSFFSDCSFLVAESGEKAIELAGAHHPAIVIMDIQLPGINGIEAIRRIKKISPQAQAVVLTVMKDSAYKEEAMAAGASAFINKQHMHAELIPAIAKLLPSQSAAGEEL